jgi:catechol 2,3-dioxygenase-like lactoylglutathione lyase family enzyme
MKRTWTIIGVGDVPRSFKWYQALFGQPVTLPAHNYFGQILDSDGTVLLCLHEWGAHEHPSLMSPDHGTPGNGLLLFFRVDDFDVALQRARSLVTQLEEEPHVNPNTQTKEFSLEIRTGITLRSVRSLRPDEALLLPSAGRAGDRRPPERGLRGFPFLFTGKIMPARATHFGCSF